MKALMTTLLFLVSSTALAEDTCDVKGKMANDKAIVVDQSSWGHKDIVGVMAEAHLHTQSGAACVSVDDQDGVIVLSAYYPVLDGPDAGKLMQLVEIFRK